jgi:hypothetical protein
VVEEQVGSTPFTTEEYDRLPRRGHLKSPETIDAVLSRLKFVAPGLPHQNHPGSTYRAYLKVNTARGFYWLYCDVTKDRTSSYFRINANTLNATNPNGSGSYYFTDYSDVQKILEHNVVGP